MRESGEGSRAPSDDCIICGGRRRCPPGAAWAAGENSPADVTMAIYHIYAGPKGDYQAGNLDDKRVAAYLSKSLRAALKAMDARSKKLNEPILDFDPVTDSQDPASREAGDRP